MGGFNKNILATGLINMGRDYATATRDAAQRDEERQWKEAQDLKRLALEEARRQDDREYAKKVKDDDRGYQEKTKAEEREYTDQKPSTTHQIDGEIANEGMVRKAIAERARMFTEMDTAQGPVQGKIPELSSLADEKDLRDFEQSKELENIKMSGREKLLEDRLEAARQKALTGDGADGKITEGERKAFVGTLDRMLFSAYQAEKGGEVDASLFDEDPSGGKKVNIDRVLAAASPTLKARYERALVGGEEMLPGASNKPGSVALFAWQESETKKPSQNTEGMLGGGQVGSPGEVKPAPEKPRVKTAPPSALAALKANPGKAAEFKAYYGYLPEGY